MRRGSNNVALRSVGVAQTTLYNGTTAEVLRPVQLDLMHIRQWVSAFFLFKLATEHDFAVYWQK